MLITNNDTLVRKIKESCDSGEIKIPFDEIYVVDYIGKSVFTINVNRYEFTIPIRQTWKNILHQFLEKTTKYNYMSEYLIHHIYDNIPGVNFYVYITRIDDTVTLDIENETLNKKASIEFHVNEIESLYSDDVKWKQLKKQILSILVFDQDCPICFSSNIQIMTTCYECHHDVCLSCTVKSINITGKHICPLCRCEETLDIMPMNRECKRKYIQTLLQEYLN